MAAIEHRDGFRSRNVLASRLSEAQAASGLGLVFFCAGLAPWHDDPAIYQRLLARLPPGRPAAIFRSAHIRDLCALLAHAYGFLAVFAAGLALRRVERHFTGDKPAQELAAMASVGAMDEIATDPEKAPAYMAQAVLWFNEQLERIGEVAVVVLLGGLLVTVDLPSEAPWFIPLLFLFIRPLSVTIGLSGARVSIVQRSLVSWFGIRGVGSIYYLMFAIQHGLPDDLARRVTALTLSTVAISIVLHLQNARLFAAGGDPTPQDPLVTKLEDELIGDREQDGPASGA